MNLGSEGLVICPKIHKVSGQERKIDQAVVTITFIYRPFAL